MPVINLEYNDEVSEGDALSLSQAIRDIVSESTGIEDVFTYGNNAKIKIKVAPIEIFIKMSAHKIKDQDALVSKIKSKLKDWKIKTNFKHLINLTFIPMNWRIEMGI